MTRIDNEADIQVRNTVAELLNTHANDVMLICVVGETVETRLVPSRYSLQNRLLYLFVYFIYGLFNDTADSSEYKA
jgi:hypothetical protein